jgi:predicted CXXCH cytochrome family protein
LDSFGGTVGTNYISTPIATGTTPGGINGDISASHPISFTYDTALAAPATEELNDPSTTPSGLGGMIDADLLFGGKLECASCHDVHDGQGGGPSGYLLVKPNTGSQLCTTCHTK